MRLTRIRVRRLVAAAVVASIGTVLSVLPANSASAGQSAPDRAHRCERYHLSEKMIQLATNMPPGVDVPAGFMATWIDDVYDFGTTNKFATASGTMDIIEETAEGHDIEYQFELFHFPRGTFMAESAFDRTLVIEGQWITQPITGLNGGYAGWGGDWTWRAVPSPEPGAPPMFENLFVLCPHGAHG